MSKPKYKVGQIVKFGEHRYGRYGEIISIELWEEKFPYYEVLANRPFFVIEDSILGLAHEVEGGAV